LRHTNNAKIVWTGLTGPLSKLPGPWYTKYTNLVLRYQTVSGKRIFYVDNLHQHYGGVVRISPNETAVSDIAGVSQIHKIGAGYLKSDFYSSLLPTDTPGIFPMRDPYAHAARRRLFARPFSNTSLSSNWDVEIRTKANLAVTRIRQDAMGSSQGADVLKWWTLMANDVIAHLSFGESSEMLEMGKVCNSAFISLAMYAFSNNRGSKHHTSMLFRLRLFAVSFDLKLELPSGKFSVASPSNG